MEGNLAGYGAAGADETIPVISGVTPSTRFRGACICDSAASESGVAACIILERV